MNVTADDIRRFAADPMAFFDAAFSAAGLAMADFQRERFAILTPALISLARGERPSIGRFWIEAVKGASKDSDIALCLLWLLAFTSVPIDGQVGAADADQSGELLKAAKLWLGALTWIKGRITHQSWKLICEDTKSTITFVAADAAGGAHGSRCLLYVINEITHIAKTEFWQTLLDNAVKVPNGVVIIAGNSGFTDSEAYELRKIYLDSPATCAAHIFCGPVPWQDPRELVIAKRRMPPVRAARLYEGVWTTGSGDALRPEDITAAFATGVEPMRYTDAAWTVSAGLDLSVSRDFSAFVCVAKHNRTGRYRVARCRLWRPPSGGKIDQEQVEAEIVRAHKDYRLATVACDPYQAEYLISRLKKKGIKIEDRQQSGKNLVEQCMVLLEQFTSLNIDVPPQFSSGSVNLKYDLEHLRVEERSYGMRLVSDRERGAGHGDLASALSIAMSVAKTTVNKRVLVA